MFFRKKRPARPSLSSDVDADVVLFERESETASTISAADAKRVITDTLPIVEEQVEIGTRQVKGDTLRVEMRTDTRIEELTAPLRRESYSVERVSVDEVVDYIPEIRRENGLTIIPVMEERLVTVKQLVLREEIHIRERHSVEETTVSVPLRSQRAEVSRSRPES